MYEIPYPFIFFCRGPACRLHYRRRRKNLQASHGPGSPGSHRHRHYDYQGYTIYAAYEDDGSKKAAKSPFHEEFDDYTSVFTFGGYASAYYGPIFFTYSVIAYKPTFEDENLWSKEDDDVVLYLPYVITNYYSLGYRLDEHWEVSIGAANVFGSFAGYHWSGHAGISFYML